MAGNKKEPKQDPYEHTGQQVEYDYSDPNNQYYVDPNQYYYGYDYTGYTDPSVSVDAGYTNYDPYYTQSYYEQPTYTASYYAEATLPESVTAITTAAASKYTPSFTPAATPTPAATSSGTTAVKTYYPSSSNPNNPIGPIIITKSGYAGPSTTPTTSTAQNDKKKGKKKPVVRAAGGEVWEDNTLVDWDENDYRLFAGDLGNEVTEELLFKAFSKYPSLIRTRVVRDNRTMKSKGFGFISFKDPDDFVKAWREMNGKYVGNRPIKLRKSNWKERNIDVRAKKERERVGPYPKSR
ncbi:hypothetical protein BDB01DRAFT_799228 [Pilobolus umbonatus]|nr:hypothetical protein BDB01DRAFT_799228 [Pilobolus umbonatus]